MPIYGNMVGGGAPLKTLILQDEEGNEMTGIVVGQEVIFTANAATDIRDGKVAATDEGVVTGAAIIPNYETSTGVKIIKAGAAFKFSLTLHDMYDYTKLQCLICSYNSSINNSVATDRVVIDNNVYGTNSTVVLATVTKNADDKSINLNIANTSENMYTIRYFTYKELY